MTNKLLLINPRAEQDILVSKIFALPPLWAAYIAAVTPEEWIVELIDENIENRTFQSFDADLVGVSATTQTANRAYVIAAFFKKNNKTVIMGGIHVSMVPEEALGFCDAVVIGEAEGIWPAVIQDFESGKLQKIPAYPVIT